MTSHFLAIRVRPAGGHVPRQADRSLPACWLLAEWPPHALASRRITRRPTLPADTPIEELVRLAKIRWRIEHDYRELKTGLGLDHFEGRSFAPWHRHVTLAALAQAFCTLLRTDPKARAAKTTLYQVLHQLQIVLALILGACPLCCQPLILQRHLGERIAASPVVAEPGLVLASSAPGGPGPDSFGVGCAGLDQADQQPADLR